MFMLSLLTPVCFRFRRRVKHYHILRREDATSRIGRCYFLYHDDFQASSIQELLRHYTTHPLAPRHPPVPVIENDSVLTTLKLSTAILDRWLRASTCHSASQHKLGGVTEFAGLGIWRTRKLQSPVFEGLDFGGPYRRGGFWRIVNVIGQIRMRPKYNCKTFWYVHVTQTAIIVKHQWTRKWLSHETCAMYQM